MAAPPYATRCRHNLTGHTSARFHDKLGQLAVSELADAFIGISVFTKPQNKRTATSTTSQTVSKCVYARPTEQVMDLFHNDTVCL